MAVAPVDMSKLLSFGYMEEKSADDDASSKSSDSHFSTQYLPHSLANIYAISVQCLGNI